MVLCDVRIEKKCILWLVYISRMKRDYYWEDQNLKIQFISFGMVRLFSTQSSFMNINFFQYDIFFYFVIKIFMIDSEFKIVYNKMNTINKFEKYEIVWSVLYIYKEI